MLIILLERRFHIVFNFNLQLGKNLHMLLDFNQRVFAFLEQHNIIALRHGLRRFFHGFLSFVDIFCVIIVKEPIDMERGVIEMRHQVAGGRAEYGQPFIIGQFFCRILNIQVAQAANQGQENNH